MTGTAESVCLAAEQAHRFLLDETQLFCISSSDVGSNKTSGSVKHVFSTNGGFEERGTSSSDRITRTFSVKFCANLLQSSSVE